MRISAIINNTDTVYLVEFAASRFTSSPTLKIQSDDLSYIKNIFEDIQKIEVFYGDVKTAEYTDYDGYSSIQYLGKVFCETEQRFVECLQITLTKTSLVEQIKRIEEKIDDTIDFDAMTAEEYKAYLLKDISAKGEAQIFAGTGVVLSDGTSKVFSYDLKDQSNLSTAVFIAEKLDDLTMSFPYHETGHPCNLYTVADIITIYMTLQMMSVQVQTRVNLLLNYIRTLTTKDELMAITYETALPDEYQVKYDEIVSASMAVMERLKNKYFPTVTTSDEDVNTNDDGTETTDNGEE